MLGRTLLAGIAVGGLAAGLMVVGPSAAAQDPAAQSALRVTSAPPISKYPHLKVTRRIGPLAAGLIFTGPRFPVARPAGAPVGPLITDDHGRPVYFMNLAQDLRATDVRVQRYNGQRVLTYWMGKVGANPGVGSGNDYILNQNYKLIRTIHGHGAGCQADLHEFLLTPGNSAIIVCYEVKHRNATAFGGAADQAIFDGVVQEINLATAKVVFEWHSLGHIKLAASHTAPAKNAPNTPWDYFHLNSVNIDTDHNLLISSRHTWTVYKVNRHTGRVIWELGGKYSNFAIGKGAAFSWQHDAEPLGENFYRIFDNAWNADPNTPPTHPQSRVLTIKLNLTTHTATGVGKLIYPASTLLAGYEGNAQQLPGNHLMVGWGAANRVTEFNAHRNMVFDSHFAKGYDTYRAYKSLWVGRPSTGPSEVISSPGGVKQADGIWNGASNVASWRVYGGPGPARLKEIASIRWNGYDTAFRLSNWPAYMRLAAIGPHGSILKRTGIHHT